MMTTASAPTEYMDFLRTKWGATQPTGIDIPAESLHIRLFPFQRDVVSWALMRGKAALFEECGLGKTLQELVWADEVCKATSGNVIVLTPLAVARQTEREAAKFGIDGAGFVRDQSECHGFRICITNYEKLHLFDPTAFVGVVLDESSILKSFTSRTRKEITEAFLRTPYKLAATATPAPNDFTEVGNHAEFLGIMSRTEMLSEFFVHDGGSTSEWRIKGHAEELFWKWVTTWAVTLRSPADIGHDDTRYTLPPLCFEHHVLEVIDDQSDNLFASQALSLTDQRRAKRTSLSARVEHAKEIIYGKRTVAAMVSREQGQEDAGGEGGTQSIHEGVQVEEQGEVEEIIGGTGESQREATSDVLRKSRGQRGCKGKSKGVAAEQPRQTQSAEDSSVRVNDGSVSASDGGSGGEVRDMRILGSEQSEILPGSGSLSHDGQCSGTAVHELQPRDRQTQGRSEDIGSSIGVSEVLPKWVIWCELNDEQNALAAVFKDDCVSISGADKDDEKIRKEQLWREGSVPIIISKPSIFGHGMNWQHCANVLFAGISHSYEQTYQAIRRCWRFGQERAVSVHFVLSEAETPILRNLQRKEADAQRMQASMVSVMQSVADWQRISSSRETNAYENKTSIQFPPWLRSGK